MDKTPDAESPDVNALVTDIREHQDALIAAAQLIYDQWEQDENGEDLDFGTGGICASISNEMAGVLGEFGLDAEEGSQDGDDHSFLVVTRGTERALVDIPCRIYESGGGYVWRKRPGVIFCREHLVIEKL